MNQRPADPTRREVLRRTGALTVLAATARLLPAYAQAGTSGGAPGTVSHSGAGSPSPAADGDTDVVDLVIAEAPFTVNGRTATAMTINGTVPGPLIRLREGRLAVLNVTNRLREATSIHWHGLIVPYPMDGVPGVNFAGIPAGTTFTYRFPVRQSGTYWCHSHSGGQEMLGIYAPMILDPAGPEPLRYDREHVIVLSDWNFDSPERILDRLKKEPGYYNYQRRTVGDFVRDAARFGLGATIRERAGWAKMRMDPTDIADVTGAANVFLLNGLSSEGNWTGLFRTGETVRLRFINAATMTFYDVRIPGLRLTVVAADGQPVQPVAVDEFRFGPAETYDVLVGPVEDRAYTVFAEPMDRSGFVRGTLAPRAGMSAPIPPRRRTPLRSMADMGMDMAEMSGMEMPGMVMKRDKHGGTARNEANAHGGAGGSGGEGAGKAADGAGHAGHGGGQAGPQGGGGGAAATGPGGTAGHNEQAGSGGMPGMGHGMEASATTVNGSKEGKGATGPSLPGSPTLAHGPNRHGPGNQAEPMMIRSRLDDPGVGLGEDGWRVLVYTDLKAVTPYPDRREPARQVELHITGNMERFMWSFDGKKYSEARRPIPFRFGERLRLSLVNDTMMEHPIHLHGMWMELENGAGEYQPRKHTVSVKPAERVTLAITPEEPGFWALHCHLLFHMELGMFRVVEVTGGTENGAESVAPPQPAPARSRAAAPPGGGNGGHP